MSTHNGSWFTTSEIIEIWIGIATTVSAAVAVLSYRFLKGGFFLSLPHVEGQALSATQPNHVWLHLEGPHADQWRIVSLTVMAPRTVHFMQRIDEEDGHGGRVWQTGSPIGRALDYRSSPVILSSLDSPVKLRIKLSLKALPKVTSWRTTTISNIT